MRANLTVKEPDRPARGSTAERLLAAASGLMIERNSIEFSLSELAQRSGVNSALVKYHFGNKEGLLLALLRQVSETQVQNLDYLINQPISPTAKLKVHISAIINAYYRYPYINRLLHCLLHESSAESASAVSAFFVKPIFDFERRLLAEGLACGEFRQVDPVLFYTSLIGACDHLFHSRHIMTRALGVGGVTDEVRQQYIEHMIDLICGGMVLPAAKRRSRP